MNLLNFITSHRIRKHNNKKDVERIYPDPNFDQSKAKEGHIEKERKPIDIIL